MRRWLVATISSLLRPQQPFPMSRALVKRSFAFTFNQTLSPAILLERRKVHGSREKSGIYGDSKHARCYKIAKTNYRCSDFGKQKVFKRQEIRADRFWYISDNVPILLRWVLEESQLRRRCRTCYRSNMYRGGTYKDESKFKHAREPWGLMGTLGRISFNISHSPPLFFVGFFAFDSRTTKSEGIALG